MRVFDRALLRARRERASGLDGCDYLFTETAARLADRLLDVQRSFPLALELGSRRGLLAEAMEAGGRVGRLVSADMAAGMVRGAGLAVVADEELLPFCDGRFDAIFSNLSLHWVNDLPGALIQARRALKSDGLFLAAMFGGATLAELRRALMEAELEVFGGMSPRVSPFADVRDVGALLQRAGFALPVVDVDTIAVSYPDPAALMTDLRRMGEANAIAARIRQGGSRRIFAAMDRHYPRDADGRITARFEIVYATGWSPHESQQRPQRPGTATVHLSEVLRDKS